jgi:quinone-modifying oxidoreductase subunit QmoB
MEKKYGVYICKGCGIGDSIDTEKLAKSAKRGAIKEENIKTHDIMCSPEGVQLIKNDIKGGVNTIIIAACSPRVKYEEFDFPGAITERVNIREFVAWAQPPKTDDTQSLAEDYMLMGVVKAEKSDLPEPAILENLSNTILVIGGGITGMTAALESAKAGYQVVLVEKESQLGGFANKLYKKIPTRNFTDPVIVDTEIDKVIAEAESNPNIKVYKSAKIEKTEGQPGLYDVTIASSSGTETVKIGAIVMASGWVPYDATKLDYLGYGKFKNVVTNFEFEDIARKGVIKRPSDGKEAKKVAFIQCAGQRHPDHLPYCSSMCCATSLKQARYVRQSSDALAMIFIRYQNLRRLEAFIEKHRTIRIMLTKADVTGVSDAGKVIRGDGKSQ